MSQGSKQQTQKKDHSVSSQPCFCNKFNDWNKKEWGGGGSYRQEKTEERELLNATCRPYLDPD